MWPKIVTPPAFTGTVGGIVGRVAGVVGAVKAAIEAAIAIRVEKDTKIKANSKRKKRMARE
jgi:hypothetical protein